MTQEHDGRTGDLCPTHRTVEPARCIDPHLFGQVLHGWMHGCLGSLPSVRRCSTLCNCTLAESRCCDIRVPGSPPSLKWHRREAQPSCLGVERNSFGAYFPDLASNMLGSFIMGGLLASSTFDLPSGKAVAAFPLNHPWQEAPELLVGLRTGFCGSLTTFASWEYSLVIGLVGGSGRQGGQWAEFLWGLVIGTQLAISSYVFGGHLASAVDRWVWGTLERRKQGAANGNVGATASPQRKFKVLRKTNVAALLLFCLFTALWVVLAVIDLQPRHAARRQQWFAILMAPFGATLRWKLVALHGKLPGWTWFPLGTFVANISACCIDFGLQAADQRANGLGYWVRLMFGAIRVGFSGSLSTVSTFVAEVHKALSMWPNQLHGHAYVFVTLSCGALSGVVIYGWSVWT